MISQLTPVTPDSRLKRLTICSSSEFCLPVLVRIACTSTLSVCSTSSLFRDLREQRLPTQGMQQESTKVRFLIGKGGNPE